MGHDCRQSPGEQSEQADEAGRQKQPPGGATPSCKHVPFGTLIDCRPSSYFDGSGGLSDALRKRGLVPWHGFDLRISPDMDICDIRCFQAELALVKEGKVWGAHCAPECRTFCRLYQLNKGTRSLIRPQGSTYDSFRGDLIANRTARLCHEVHCQGGIFPIKKSPLNSGLWKLPAIRTIIKLDGARWVRFDPCCYWLKPVDDGAKRYKKPTFLFGKFRSLELFSGARCKWDHAHAVIKGGVKLGGKWHRRSSLAAPSPPSVVRQACPGV